MNAIRVQIHLKYFFDNHSSPQFYNFWYAFQPSKLPTIKDVLEDIRVNYIKDQLSLFIEDNDERALIIHLDDCQLLPFTSSQILRDNDRIILMPLMRYKLHKKSLEDSASLQLSTSMTTEPPSVVTPIVSENNHKRQRIESMEQDPPSQSTITILPPTENVEEQPRKKKTKTKPIEDQVPQVAVIQPTPVPPPVVQQTPETVIQSVIEKETSSDAPISLPSTSPRIRELKSKTPAWKAQKPAPRGDAQNKVHIRFDSDSEEESPSHPSSIIVEEKSVEPLVEEQRIVEPLPLSNGSNSSVRVNYVPRSSLPDPDPIKPSEETKSKKKTVDLLFEMKQHKPPEEKQGKRIRQQHGRKRAQQRKRALDYFSLANVLDQAFGLNKDDLEKQFVSSNGYHTSSSSTPQTLPTSFNKLARLPLVAEAIDDNEKTYDLYPPLTQCPTVQMRIAFKLLELSEDFCPTMSTFKEGTVIEVHPVTNQLTIELDKPLQNVFHQPSKFYAPEDEQTEETSNTVTVPFSDLNSARLLSGTNGTTTTT